MDVSRWGLDQIMMLPDHCFGSRWPIVLLATGSPAAVVFNISEMALPERCVVWELAVQMNASALAEGRFYLRLGDVLPTTWAEFLAYDTLFRGVNTTVGLDRLMYVSSMSTVNWQNFKMPVQAAGRRLVLGIEAGQMVAAQCVVAVTISSIPREVPDCLLSV